MTRTDYAAALFRCHPNEWVSALELARGCGYLAWRTEVSRCRTQRGMRIENKVVRVNGSPASFYRWTPGVMAHV